MEKFYFETESWFLGRNGRFRARGLHIYKEENSNIVISPITSKNQVGRCDIAVPEESLEEFINALEYVKKT